MYKIITYLLWKHCCKMENENKNKNKNVSSSVGVFYFMKHIMVFCKRDKHIERIKAAKRDCRSFLFSVEVSFVV